jgi:hypothetical protein
MIKSLEISLKQAQTKLDSLIEMFSRLHLDGSNTFAADTDERSSIDYNHEAGFITCSNSEDDYPVIWENPTWTTTSSLKCYAGLAEGETMRHPTIAPRSDRGLVETPNLEDNFLSHPETATHSSTMHGSKPSSNPYSGLLHPI